MAKWRAAMSSRSASANADPGMRYPPVGAEAAWELVARQ